MSLISHLKKSYEEVVVGVNSTNTLTGKEIVRKYTIKRYTLDKIIIFFIRFIFDLRAVSRNENIFK